MFVFEKIFTWIKAVKLYHLSKILSSYIFQISNLIVVFFLSASEYGVLTLIIATSQLVFIMSAGISNGALLNIGTRRFIKSGRYFDVVIYRYSFVIGMLILLGSMFFIMGTELSEWLDIYSLTAYVPVLVFSYIMYELATQLLYPSNFFKQQVYIELLLACVFLISILLVVRSIENFIDMYLYISIFGFVVTITFFVKNKLYASFNVDRVVFKEVYMFSVWQIVSVFSIYVLNSGYSYLLVYYDFSKENIGVLNFSLKLFLGMSGVFSLALILMPRLVHSSANAGYLKNINKYMLFMVFVLGLVYLLASIIIYQIIDYMGRDEYLLSVKFMIYLTPAFLCMAYSNLLNTLFSNTPLFRVAQAVIFVQVLVFMISAYYMLGALGSIGLVYSYSISYFVGAVSTYVLYVFNKEKITGVVT